MLLKCILLGKKTIIGSMEVAQHVTTHSTINGVLLQDDVMTTTGNQVINAKKTFNDLNIQGKHVKHLNILILHIITLSRTF